MDEATKCSQIGDFGKEKVFPADVFRKRDFEFHQAALKLRVDILELNTDKFDSGQYTTVMRRMKALKPLIKEMKEAAGNVKTWKNAETLCENQFEDNKVEIACLVLKTSTLMFQVRGLEAMHLPQESGLKKVHSVMSTPSVQDWGWCLREEMPRPVSFDEPLQMKGEREETSDMKRFLVIQVGTTICEVEERARKVMQALGNSNAHPLRKSGHETTLLRCMSDCVEMTIFLNKLK
jgi:hypothetical protein